MGNYLGLLELNTLSAHELKDMLDYAYQPARRSTLASANSELVAGLYLEQHDTATTWSFQLACQRIGATPLILNTQEDIFTPDKLSTTARLLPYYLDVLLIQLDSTHQLYELSRYSSLPIINLGTEDNSPCEALTAYLSLKKLCGYSLQGLKLTLVNPPANLAHSHLIGCAKLGINLSLYSEQPRQLNETIITAARCEAAKQHSTITITSDLVSACTDSDAIWLYNTISGFQFPEKLLSLAHPRVVLLHNNPLNRGSELSTRLFERYSSMMLAQQADKTLIYHTLIDYCHNH